jgi:hypothetical protein
MPKITMQVSEKIYWNIIGQIKQGQAYHPACRGKKEKKLI